MEPHAAKGRRLAMAYHYLTMGDEESPYRVPSVEIFHAQHGECQHCGEAAIGYAGPPECGCQSVGGMMLHAVAPQGEGYFYWHCTPGFLPDGAPIGPYATEAEALAAAREGSGVCPHGVPDDWSEEDEDAPLCMECDAPTLYVLRDAGGAFLAGDRDGNIIPTENPRAAAAWADEASATRVAADQLGQALAAGMRAPLEVVRLSDDDARAWGVSS